MLTEGSIVQKTLNALKTRLEQNDNVIDVQSEQGMYIKRHAHLITRQATRK
ncbi:hypothetical protein RRU94_18645 [Domibacillus sp. DTU_2020_1001157_1_SI_ALB_TIR_016]|uniref:hypothetical protein n=1 Tax=Domibacillus sp. DTU_2020_1001157_1_SI_ALB_TIR_016 TaxID=3077789 RepID=UPI0028F09E82|nr:hypothetical protein [Domibacillus sp. DTU_2020_1001157_1_SI_ALB_TIR_016]WNS79548.1 hypothetical protein RRU94_18645 [Domibacillus sp. DTU_2020_1001157_1_SI_ALB_TIR_016]